MPKKKKEPILGDPTREEKLTNEERAVVIKMLDKMEKENTKMFNFLISIIFDYYKLICELNK